MEQLALQVTIGAGAALGIVVLKTLYDMASFRRSERIDWNDPSTYDRPQ